jgi:hypothetical protein
MLTFREYLRLREGGMVDDKQADASKIEPTPTSVAAKWKYKLDNSGQSGGPGKKPVAAGTGAAPLGPAPTAPPPPKTA